MNSFLLDPSASDALRQKLLLPLPSITHAPGQSKALRPSPGDYEAPADYRVISSVDDDNRNSFAKLSVDMSSFHDIPNLDFNLDDNDPTDTEFHPMGSSESSSDSNSRLSNTESNHYELDSFQSAVATAQGQSISPVTHDEPDSFESDPRPTAEGPDDGQSNGRFTGTSDPIEKFSNSDEGCSNSKNRKKKTSTWKSISRKAQGTLLS